LFIIILFAFITFIKFRRKYEYEYQKLLIKKRNSKSKLEGLWNEFDTLSGELLDYIKDKRKKSTHEFKKAETVIGSIKNGIYQDQLEIEKIFNRIFEDADNEYITLRNMQIGEAIENHQHSINKIWKVIQDCINGISNAEEGLKIKIKSNVDEVELLDNLLKKIEGDL